MESPILSRRAFVISATSAAAVAPAWPSWGMQVGADLLDVRQFGAVGDGVHDDTQAIAGALSASPAVFVPRGIYAIEQIRIPGGRSLVTEGFGTVFRQQRGMPQATSLLRVIGSDVRIGDCRTIGNIASDEGEWNHGVEVRASVETGPLSNIRIGNIRGLNLRGDVVCLWSRDGTPLRSVSVQHVHGDNIYRHVMTIVGGQQIAIERVTGSRVGYLHLDIEPEDHSGPVIDCTVGTVLGGLVQVAGSTRNAYVDRTRLGLVEAVGDFAKSIPPYPVQPERRDALTVRNIRSLAIGRFRARGFDGAAILQIWNDGALEDQLLHIGQAELIDCAKGRGSERAYIAGSRRATRIAIDDLSFDTPPPGVDLIRDCKQVRIGRSRGHLAPGSRLVGQTNALPPEIPYLLGGAGAALAAWKMFEQRERWTKAPPAPRSPQ